MKLIKYALISASIFFYSSLTYAVQASGQSCTGTIKEIRKWVPHTRLSILLSGSNRFFSMPEKTEEAIALTAYALGQPITISWSTGIVTVSDCVNDWAHYTVLDGSIGLVAP